MDIKHFSFLRIISEPVNKFLGLVCLRLLILRYQITKAFSSLLMLLFFVLNHKKILLGHFCYDKVVLQQINMNVYLMYYISK